MSRTTKAVAALGTLGVLGALLWSRRASAAEGSGAPFQTGQVSWYGPGLEGNLTANGEHFDSSGMTAAHPKLKFGTMVEVTDLATGKAVVVRVNDRGPYHGGRILDLAQGAAEALGITQRGVINAELRIVG